MAETIITWKQALWSRLHQFLRIEQRIVLVGVLISALFAVLTPRAPLLFMAACILTIGNLMAVLQMLSSRLYGNRPSPWNWVFFLSILAAGSAFSALTSVELLRWMMPNSPPFWIVFHDSWRIVMVVCMGTGITGYAVMEVQRKLNEKNTLLEQVVERGNTALHQQEQELNRALDIQKDLLPKDLPQLPGIELAGAWQPARTVGGDYFDVLRLDEDRLGICVGDVAGKGLTASLLMANLQATFRAYATPEATPAEVCTKLNSFICANVATGKFITFFYAILDAKNHTLIYENAGHCPGLLLRAAGTYESLAGHGGVLGVVPEWNYSDSMVRLTSGDRLLIFTDGVTEAENSKAVEFGAQRIVQAAGPAGNTAAETKHGVMDGVTAFRAGEFLDDVTLVVAAIH